MAVLPFLGMHSGKEEYRMFNSQVVLLGSFYTATEFEMKRNHTVIPGFPTEEYKRGKGET